jgi:hypothetical protein
MNKISTYFGNSLTNKSKKIVSRYYPFPERTLQARGTEGKASGGRAR